MMSNKAALFGVSTTFSSMTYLALTGFSNVTQVMGPKHYGKLGFFFFVVPLVPTLALSDTVN